MSRASTIHCSINGTGRGGWRLPGSPPSGIYTQALTGGLECSAAPVSGTPASCASAGTRVKASSLPDTRPAGIAYPPRVRRSACRGVRQRICPASCASPCPTGVTPARAYAAPLSASPDRAVDSQHRQARQIPAAEYRVNRCPGGAGGARRGDGPWRCPPDVIHRLPELLCQFLE